MNTQNNKTSLLLSYGFRPLFILVCCQALFHIFIWQLAWNGYLRIDWNLNPSYWHAHEMITGFAGAAIAGFLLTAVATWTGRAPVSGLPLLVLCASWVVARSALQWPNLAALANIFYWLFLLILMMKEVVGAENTRNYKILLLLLVMLVLESAFQYSVFTQNNSTQQIILSQLWLLILIINTIGGRIIPAFTRNWLRAHRPELTNEQLPKNFGRVDLIATIALIVFAAATLLFRTTSILSALAICTSLLLFWRLIRWKGFYAFADPLVWMMHLAYAWIPVGVFILALSYENLVPVSAGIHALAIGTIASMIVSVASRAALGHTNRALKAHPLLTTAIVLLSVATIFRIAAAILREELLMHGATLFWLLGFVCFAVHYLPILLQPAKINSPG